MNCQEASFEYEQRKENLYGQKTLEKPSISKWQIRNSKAEYDALEPEFQIIQAIVDARNRSGLTQKQLSEKTGIAQADISKLENGNANSIA